MAPHREGISPKDFAATIGVSESSVKRWVDQGLLRAIRTAGGHRRISPEEAARWIREHRIQAAKVERLGDELELASGAEALRSHVEAFYEHLNAGRGDEARSMALRLFLAGHTIAALADALIAPAMARIGALWQHGDEGVFVEHRATDLAVHVVKELDGAAIDQRARKRGVAAVCAALEGDSYALPPMLCAATLGEIGFKPTNLGPSTPTAVIELAAERLEAQVVCLSVSVMPPPPLVSQVGALVQRLRAKGTRVAVGGRHVDTLGLLASSEGLYIGPSMTSLAHWARSVAAG